MDKNIDKKLIRAQQRIAILEKMIEDSTREIYLEKQEAERSRNFLDKILSSLSSGVLVANAELDVILINDSAVSILGGVKDELIGTSLIELLRIEKVEDKVKGGIEELLNMHGEALLVKKNDSSTIPILYAFSGVRGEYFELEAIVCLLSDLTELKNLERQLLQAQKLESVGQLAAGVAHEINTPIQYVRDNTVFVMDEFKNIISLLKSFRGFLSNVDSINSIPPNLKSTSETIIKQIEDIELDYLVEEIPAALSQAYEGTESVASIVRSMKDFSHPGSKEKTQIDINQVIRSTITVSKNEWKYISIMNLNLDESLPHIFGYPGELNQVMLNLVVNAAHAIEEKSNTQELGSIGITTKTQEKGVSISISDSGTGIPEHIREKIFDPFFTTKEVGKGTGQGLSIVHSTFVNRHSGELKIETVEGQGTTFNIFLPFR